MEKAKAKLHAAETLFQSNEYDSSVGCSYYAIFTAARTLLALKGLDSKKHSGVMALFNQNFIKDGPLSKDTYQTLRKAKTNRELADYEDYVNFSREEAEAQLLKAKDFLNRIEEVLISIL